METMNESLIEVYGMVEKWYPVPVNSVPSTTGTPSTSSTPQYFQTLQYFQYPGTPSTPGTLSFLLPWVPKVSPLPLYASAHPALYFFLF